MGSTQVDKTPRPWRREPVMSERPGLYRRSPTFEERFDCCSRKNLELDIETKLMALRVSPSVVSLVSHIGEKKLFVASGTIIECKAGDIDGCFTCLIMTSASVLKGRVKEEVYPLADVKVIAYLANGAMCEAEVYLCNFHFNVTLLKINTNGPQPIARIRYLGGSTPIVSNSQTLRRHGDAIVSGNKVIALGRHYQSHDLMAAPGILCADRCTLDCDELCMASCKISLGGIGGPLINYDGEVIGINFYNVIYTPFLPMNIVWRCLELLKTNRSVPQLRLGLHAVNLSDVTESLLEIIVRKFPTISEGVVIEKVFMGSLAESVGIHLSDVIVKCHERPVKCPSEFFGMMLDKAGEEVEIVVMRPSDGNLLRLKLVADVTRTGEVYRWPIPKVTIRPAVY